MSASVGSVVLNAVAAQDEDVPMIDIVSSRDAVVGTVSKTVVLELMTCVVSASTTGELFDSKSGGIFVVIFLVTADVVAISSVVDSIQFSDAEPGTVSYEVVAMGELVESIQFPDTGAGAVSSEAIVMGELVESIQISDTEPGTVSLEVVAMCKLVESIQISDTDSGTVTSEVVAIGEEVESIQFSDSETVLTGVCSSEVEVDSPGCSLVVIVVVEI